MKIKFQIRETLKKYGWKQAEIADITGLSKVIISNICTGKVSPGVDKLILISEKTNIPIEDFFTTEQEGEYKGDDIKCPYCHKSIKVTLSQD